MHNLAPSPLTIPLTQTARDLAQQFANQQATPEKGMRVYLNTLAVWAVCRYLNWLRIDADATQGDSWNPSLRALFDTADLAIPGVGKVECRPVLAGEEAVLLPPEVQENRSGYFAVQFGERLGEVELLGFYPAIASATRDRIPLTEFQSLDAFLEYLNAATPAPSSEPIQLQQWLQNIYSRSWQAVEAFVVPSTPALAFRRNIVQRGKRLALDCPLVLIVALQPEESNTFGIRLQLFPQGEQKFPTPTQLAVLTAEGEVLREISARSQDTQLQYEFGGQKGEEFTIEVVAGTSRFSESFTI